MEPHNEDTQANRLIKFGMRMGVSAALHPFEYAKVLIQVHSERRKKNKHVKLYGLGQKLFAHSRLAMNPLHQYLVKHFSADRPWSCQTSFNTVIFGILLHYSGDKVIIKFVFFSLLRNSEAH